MTLCPVRNAARDGRSFEGSARPEDTLYDDSKHLLERALDVCAFQYSHRARYGFDGRKPGGSRLATQPVAGRFTGWKRYAGQLSQACHALSNLACLPPCAVRNDQGYRPIGGRKLGERHGVTLWKEEQGETVRIGTERRAGPSFEAAHENFTVDQASSREPAGIRRLSVLEMMDEKNELGASVKAWDERAGADAEVQTAALTAVRSVPAAAHAGPAASAVSSRFAGKPSERSAGARSSGTGATTDTRPPRRG